MRILMLEDAIDDANLIAWQLKHGKLKFETQRVDSREEFVAAIREFGPDVILSDHSLPQFNSIEALKIAKENLPEVPFILVTGSVSEEFAVTCMKSGADDYILKSNLIRLPSAIEASLEKYKLARENTIIRRLNSQIEKKNAELDYLNQEKDRFMSIVSHDLQNQIGSMEYVIDIIGKSVTGISDKRDSHFRKLSRSVSNMKHLVSDFLTVNRIQRGVINPLFSLADISSLIKDVIERYEDAAVKKNITLDYNDQCKEMYLSTDISYFSIIADNIISNAIKYSLPGKKVHIELYKKNKKYYFSVADQGPGIPETDMPKLYGRFQKLTPKPTANEPTNGLGLSIVKDLVTALNGEITCSSKVGIGTTFTVVF